MCVCVCVCVCAGERKEESRCLIRSGRWLLCVCGGGGGEREKRSPGV